MNLVMNSAGEFIEVQGQAGGHVHESQLADLLASASRASANCLSRRKRQSLQFDFLRGQVLFQNLEAGNPTLATNAAVC